MIRLDRIAVYAELVAGSQAADSQAVYPKSVHDGFIAAGDDSPLLPVGLKGPLWRFEPTGIRMNYYSAYECLWGYITRHVRTILSPHLKRHM